MVNRQKVSTKKNVTLLEAILKAKLPIATSCGGQGACHLCRLSILKSDTPLPPPNDIEKKALGNVCLHAGMRLACQIKVEAPLSVEVPRLRKKKRKK